MNTSMFAEGEPNNSLGDNENCCAYYVKGAYDVVCAKDKKTFSIICEVEKSES